MIMIQVQHVFKIKILTSSTDFKYQIKYSNILLDYNKNLQKLALSCLNGQILTVCQ